MKIVNNKFTEFFCQLFRTAKTTELNKFVSIKEKLNTDIEFDGQPNIEVRKEAFSNVNEEGDVAYLRDILYQKKNNNTTIKLEFCVTGNDGKIVTDEKSIEFETNTIDDGEIFSAVFNHLGVETYHTKKDILDLMILFDQNWLLRKDESIDWLNKRQDISLCR